MLRRAVLICWAAFLAESLQGQQQPVQIEPLSQHGKDQLVALADAIKQCPRYMSSERQWGKKPNEIERWYIGPPLNVVWDVVQRTSIRSPYLGFIEFSLEYRLWIPDQVKEKYEDPFGLDFALLSQGPVKHRYEFDVGPTGLELAKMVIVGRDGSLVDEGSDDSCWQKAARNVQPIPTSAIGSQPAPAGLEIASVINTTSIIAFRGDAFLFQCDTNDAIQKEACKLWLSGLRVGLAAGGFIVDVSTKDAVKDAAVCMPKATTEDRLFSLVLQYIKSHTQQENQPTASLALAALQQAFPCKQ